MAGGAAEARLPGPELFRLRKDVRRDLAPPQGESQSLFPYSGPDFQMGEKSSVSHQNRIHTVELIHMMLSLPRLLTLSAAVSNKVKRNVAFVDSSCSAVLLAARCGKILFSSVWPHYGLCSL